LCVIIVMSSCPRNVFSKIDDIDGLDESDKMALKGILQQELGVMSVGGKRRRKTRGKRMWNKRTIKQRGGVIGPCDRLACVALLSSIIFIMNGIYCAYSATYVSVLRFALDGFVGAFNVIFGINAVNSYGAAGNRTDAERQAVAHSSQFDVIGKINLIHMYAGKLMGYINKLRNKGVSCSSILPDPMMDFLRIMCEVKNNAVTEDQAKQQIRRILEPLQLSEDIITMNGNSITIQNMSPGQIVKIDVRLLSKPTLIEADDSSYPQRHRIKSD
jgi:hypothetical protein